jgi:hypothetical protein
VKADSSPIHHFAKKLSLQWIAASGFEYFNLINLKSRSAAIIINNTFSTSLGGETKLSSPLIVDSGAAVHVC